MSIHLNNVTLSKDIKILFSYYIIYKESNILCYESNNYSFKIEIKYQDNFKEIEMIFLPQKNKKYQINILEKEFFDSTNIIIFRRITYINFLTKETYYSVGDINIYYINKKKDNSYMLKEMRYFKYKQEFYCSLINQNLYLKSLYSSYQFIKNGQDQECFLLSLQNQVHFNITKILIKKVKYNIIYLLFICNNNGYLSKLKLILKTFSVPKCDIKYCVKFISKTDNHKYLKYLYNKKYISFKDIYKNIFLYSDKNLLINKIIIFMKIPDLEKLLYNINNLKSKNITLKFQLEKLIFLKSNKCHICFLPFVTSISDNCKHAMHFECLNMWVYDFKKDFCPYCKQKIKSISNLNFIQIHNNKSHIK